MEKKLQLGKIIRKRMHDNGQSIAWLARQIHCDRSNLYKILKKSDMDTDIIYKISIALRYDFFELFSKELKLRAETPDE